MTQTKDIPVTRKNKVVKQEHKAVISPAEAALPATPQTLLSDHEAPTMDSDEEVQSMLSGSDDGFGEDQDSSIDFGAGASRVFTFPARERPATDSVQTRAMTLMTTATLALTRRTRTLSLGNALTKSTLPCTVRKTFMGSRSGRSERCQTS